MEYSVDSATFTGAYWGSFLLDVPGKGTWEGWLVGAVGRYRVTGPCTGVHPIDRSWDRRVRSMHSDGRSHFCGLVRKASHDCGALPAAEEPTGCGNLCDERLRAARRWLGPASSARLVDDKAIGFGQN